MHPASGSPSPSLHLQGRTASIPSTTPIVRDSFPFLQAFSCIGRVKVFVFPIRIRIPIVALVAPEASGDAVCIFSVPCMMHKGYGIRTTALTVSYCHLLVLTLRTVGAPTVFSHASLEFQYVSISSWVAIARPSLLFSSHWAFRYGALKSVTLPI